MRNPTVVGGRKHSRTRAETYPAADTTAPEGSAECAAAGSGASGVVGQQRDLGAVVQTELGEDAIRPARGSRPLDLAVRRGAGAVQNLGPVDVIIAALAAGVAAWGLRAVLDRVSDRSRTIWTAVAVTVLLVSLVGPLTGAMTLAATIVLECMHVAVGASLIAALAPGVTST